MKLKRYEGNPILSPNPANEWESLAVFNPAAWYEEDKLVFLVEDTGPGIPLEEINHIFTDFFRASNVGNLPGAGLGLSIAKKIMDAHKGNILIKNITDEDGSVTGTKFSVQIPLNLNTPEMRRRDWIPEEEIIE